MYRVYAFSGPVRPAKFVRYSVVAFCVFLATAIADTAPVRSATDSEIGTTVITVNKVTGFLGQLERPLNEGDRVSLNEVLETGPDSNAELQLDDDTKLALGPNGSLTLDDYVVGETESTSRVVLTVLKGAFRFITGDSDKKAYQIDTPTATIGVLGTVFDLFVHEDGDTLLLLLEGEIVSCSSTAPGSMPAVCRSLRDKDQILYMCSNGVVSMPLKWSDTLLPGVPITTAFPFLQDLPQLDPVKRTDYAAITDESEAALKLISELRERCRRQ